MYLELIVIALAAALSPIVISAFTRVMFSAASAVAVPVFVAIVAVVSFVVPLVVGRTFGAATGHSGGDDATTVLDVAAAAALALLLLWFALKNLRKRGAEVSDADDDDAATLSLRGAIGLAFAVVAANPKSIALFLAAGDVIGTETEALAEAAAAALVFAIASVAPIASVAVYQAVGGEPAAARITAAEAWMQRNGPMLKAVILGLIGAFFAYKAVTGLGKL